MTIVKLNISSIAGENILPRSNHNLNRPILSYRTKNLTTKIFPVLQNARFHVKSVARATFTSEIFTDTEDWSAESSQRSAVPCVPTEPSKKSICKNTCKGNTFRTFYIPKLLHFYQRTYENLLLSASVTAGFSSFNHFNPTIPIYEVLYQHF